MPWLFLKICEYAKQCRRNSKHRCSTFFPPCFYVCASPLTHPPWRPHPHAPARPQTHISYPWKGCPRSQAHEARQKTVERCPLPPPAARPCLAQVGLREAITPFIKTLSYLRPSSRQHTHAGFGAPCRPLRGRECHFGISADSVSLVMKTLLPTNIEFQETPLHLRPL